MRQRATAADVAKAAGVSATTVSHALNGKGRVDTKTRELVRQVAAELGYVPSRAARNLALGKSDTIGLLFPLVGRLSLDELLATDWYGKVAVAASREALAHGRALTILPELGPVVSMDLGLESVIVLDPIGDDPRCAALDEIALPYVLLGRDAHRPDAQSVVSDTEGAMRSLLDHLVERGATTIALLTSDIDWSAGHEALAAYRSWGAEVSQSPIVGTVTVSQCRTRAEITEHARNVARGMLSARHRPDAMIGLLEGFGSAIIDAAHDLGLGVPDDLLVAQDVDGLYARLTTPTITAVDTDPAEQIKQAVAMLLDPRDEAPQRIVRTRIQPRDSTAR